MEQVASTVHVNTKVLFTVFIVTSAGFVSSDFNQGRKECGDQLADFSACLPLLAGRPNLLLQHAAPIQQKKAARPENACACWLRIEMNPDTASR